MDVQIIALDIDGTLTDDQKNISNITLEALIEAEKEKEYVLSLHLLVRLLGFSALEIS